jgi:hypothetical protein
VLSFLLDAVMASLCTSRASWSSNDLSTLCNELISLHPADPWCIARMGKVLESLGPVLSLAPALAPPLIEAFFGLIEGLNALRGSVPIGNNDLAPSVREQRQLTKCYVALATKAPQAFVPYLSLIAERTLALVAAGVLGDADKNMIFEGLLVSAAAAGQDMFCRVVAALLQPLRQPWMALLEQVGDEGSLVRHMLGPISNEGGRLMIGGNEERSSTYYKLQLLMICARQAKSVGGGRGGQARCLVQALQGTLAVLLSRHSPLPSSLL